MSHNVSPSSVVTLNGASAIILIVPLLKYAPQRKIKMDASIASPIKTASARTFFFSLSI